MSQTEADRGADSGFVRVEAAESLSPGEFVTVEVEGRTVSVFNVDGEYHAIDDACPHQGGPLGEGTLAGCNVACPLHFWEFDVRTGENVDDPDCRVAKHEVRADSGRVLVRLNPDAPPLE